MIHNSRASEVLVPMVLVYLYLDPIYVNVNPITFCLSDLDLVIYTLHLTGATLVIVFFNYYASWREHSGSHPEALQYEHSLENTHN